MPHLGQPWTLERARPIVLAHRGDSAHFPENTMQAFAGAMEAGADGVELDVRVCASGELVVFHDETLARLCGDQRAVADLAFSELAGTRVAGQEIPRLIEVLEAFPNALVNVEIKKHPLAKAMAVVQASLQDIRDARAIERVLVSSFDPRLLGLLRILEPEVPRALLSKLDQGRVHREAWLAGPLGVVAVHPEEVLVDRESVARWHAQSRRVNVWTVDDPQRIAELAALGVDAIICNDPGAALAVLATGS